MIEVETRAHRQAMCKVTATTVAHDHYGRAHRCDVDASTAAEPHADKNSQAIPWHRVGGALGSAWRGRSASRWHHWVAPGHGLATTTARPLQTSSDLLVLIVVPLVPPCATRARLANVATSPVITSGHSFQHARIQIVDRSTTTTCTVGGRVQRLRRNKREGSGCWLGLLCLHERSRAIG